ncbi:GntR family transcriptional regulator [Micromonospora chalcea]
MTTPPRTPKYRQIADALRAEIESGALAQGDRLPAEADLAARFGTTHVTVRQAVRVLAEEGRVKARHGVGTFVTAPPAGDGPADPVERVRRAGAAIDAHQAAIGALSRERRAALGELIAAGWSHTRIASETGLTRQRVGQLLSD